MEKRCPCGEIMPVKLRTIIYSGKAEIDNVPIFSCPSCNHSEVFPEVKQDLTELICTLGAYPDKQTYSFNERNEWASVLVEAYHERKLSDPVVMKRLTEKRINTLLDLLNFAQTIQDEAWIADVHKRLNQLRHSLMTL